MPEQPSAALIRFLLLLFLGTLMFILLVMRLDALAEALGYGWDWTEYVEKEAVDAD